MKRTRHQFTPAMPVQKIVDGAVAGRMPNRLLISRLEIWMFRISPAPAALAKHPNKAFSAESVMSSRWRPPIGFGLSLQPAAVIGHVGAVHRAQRNAHRLRDRGLGHIALAQQHHLDALALHRGDLPPQRCFQLPDLLLGALTIRPPRIRQPKRIIPRALTRARKTPKKPSIQTAMEAVLDQTSLAGTRLSRLRTIQLELRNSWPNNRIVLLRSFKFAWPKKT